MLKHINTKHQISTLYKTLISHEEESSNDRRNVLSFKMKENIKETEWAKAFLKALSRTINTCMKLLQYKWLRRTDMPEILNKWSPGTPDTCEMLDRERYPDSVCVGMP